MERCFLQIHLQPQRVRGSSRTLTQHCSDVPQTLVLPQDLLESHKTAQIRRPFGLGASPVAQLIKNPPAMQRRRPGFDPWVGKIPWRRERLPTPAFLGFPGGSDGKESACSAGDLGSVPGLGRSPGGRKGCPLQYSGLEKSMDCIVHGVAKSWTRLSDVHSLTRPGSSSYLAVGRDGAVLQHTGSGVFKGALAPLRVGGGTWPRTAV